MTDQGRGYGSQPWNPAEPGYGEQAQQVVVPDGQGYVGQDPYAQQQHIPHQQGPYGQDQFAQQGQPYGQQQGYVQQGQFVQQQGQPMQPMQPMHPGQQQPMQQMQQVSYEQQQQWQQQPYPQQQQQQGYSQGAFPQQQQYQQQQPVPVTQAVPVVQVAPVAPQPSGPGPDGIDWEAEAAALDNPAAGTQEQYEEELYAEGDYAEGEYVEGEYPEGEYAEGEYAEGELAEHDGHTEDEYAEDEDRAPFFGGEEQDTSRESERKRKEKGKKSGRRNRGACLVVALVMLGGAGGVGYLGYGYYKSHFGPPADYVGDGTGEVQVEIASGAAGTDMATVLKNADVVKSAQAFSDAFNKNLPKAGGIQPGFYTMHHQMSAAAAIQLMLSAAGGDALIVPEGQPASAVYTLIDNKLKLPVGTTAGVAKSQVASLGLPASANGNPEGYLWPTKYSIGDGMKPLDLLKQMVSNANSNYTSLGLDAGAQAVGLKNAYDVITEASILQREGNNSVDFGQMARVISNRLATHMPLGMDTTLEYSVGAKTLTSAQINDGSNKYNTYFNQGLPPTPIANPGADAIKAVLNPTPGDWKFFYATSPTQTLFFNNQDDFAKAVKANCAAHGQSFNAKNTSCN
ncbi:UPF0755 protein [Kitasatospora sp. MAA4]|uniref:endolytic transglycosylase MltG n=1 Tax=Kitasatospora sp. MAA4 TaxID=3035093 RepID=UPI0024737D5E|nr:endolytic transglycosylase MltG [Kitasatospora sp. MAA4]MDH6131154.1 UPF0755 protein [Kitasatospora sp. MAA4]